MLLLEEKEKQSTSCTTLIEYNDFFVDDYRSSFCYREKLTIKEQVDYMSDEKGIKFNITNKKDAMNFLSNNNYFFKLKSYAKAYHKKDGKYTDLEFAYLIELSVLDSLFRKEILKLVVDIEHFLKVKLLKDLTNNECEDGYGIITELFEKDSNFKDRFIKNNIGTDNYKKINNNYYTNSLSNSIDINKPISIWKVIELISFSELVKLIEFYYEKYQNEHMNKITECLFSVRQIRNAAAHNNCLLNNIGYTKPSPIKPTHRLLSELSKIKGVSSYVKRKRMSNQVIHDFVSVLYVFDNIVTSEKVKHYTYNNLKDNFSQRLYKHIDYFEKNADVYSNLNFLKKVLDTYCG